MLYDLDECVDATINSFANTLKSQARQLKKLCYDHPDIGRMNKFLMTTGKETFTYKDITINPSEFGNFFRPPSLYLSDLLNEIGVETYITRDPMKPTNVNWVGGLVAFYSDFILGNDAINIQKNEYWYGTFASGGTHLTDVIIFAACSNFYKMMSQTNLDFVVTENAKMKSIEMDHRINDLLDGIKSGRLSGRISSYDL